MCVWGAGGAWGAGGVWGRGQGGGEITSQSQRQPRTYSPAGVPGGIATRSMISISGTEFEPSVIIWHLLMFCAPHSFAQPGGISKPCPW